MRCVIHRAHNHILRPSYVVGGVSRPMQLECDLLTLRVLTDHTGVTQAFYRVLQAEGIL